MRIAQYLYDQARYREALLKLNNIISSNLTDHTEAYYLRALSYYELSKLPEEKNHFRNFISNAADDLYKILEIAPLNVKALELHAFLINQFFDDQIHLQFSDAEKLISIPDLKSRISGLSYKALGFKKIGMPEESQRIYQELEELVVESYKNELQKKDTALSVIYLNWADCSLFEMNDPKLALSLFAKVLEHDPYNHYANYTIVKIALEFNDYDLAGKAGTRYFSALGCNQEIDADKLVNLFYAFIKEGNKNIYMAEALVTAMHTTDFNPFENKMDLFNFLLELKTVYPGAYFISGELGNILYQHKDFISALKYYEEALQHKGAVTPYYAKWILSYINGYDSVPKKLPPFLSDNAPGVAYNAYVLEMYLSSTEKNSKIKSFLLKQTSEAYKKSYDLYSNYHTYNEGNSFSNNSKYYAICCNNYGLILRQQKKFKDAAIMFKMAYRIAPSWEILDTLASAEIDARQYAEVIETTEKILTEYAGKMPFLYILLNFDRLIFALEKTGANKKIAAVAENYAAYKKMWLSLNKKDDNKPQLYKEFMQVPIRKKK